MFYCFSLKFNKLFFNKFSCATLIFYVNRSQYKAQFVESVSYLLRFINPGKVLNFLELNLRIDEYAIMHKYLNIILKKIGSQFD